jgi:hypothetical protein
MEITAHAIEAAILRAACIIIGFLWGVMIFQNKENGPRGKGVGLAIMVLFFLWGLWVTQKSGLFNALY